MRRLFRWAMRLAVALSLVLAIATGVLWGRSQGEGDMFSLARVDQDREYVRHRFLGLGSRDGVVRFYFGHDVALPSEWQHLLRTPGPLLPQSGAGWHFERHRGEPGAAGQIAKNAEDVFQIGRIVRYRRFQQWHNFAFNRITDWFIPHSYLVTLFSLPPALWVTLFARNRLRRRSRRLKGLCLECGYNLCATPGRCPECGAVPPSSAR